MKEDGAMWCTYKKKGCNSDYMDINYSKMWIVNKLATIKDESCRTNTNKGYTIPRWDTKH